MSEPYGAADAGDPHPTPTADDAGTTDGACETCDHGLDVEAAARRVMAASSGLYRRLAAHDGPTFRDFVCHCGSCRCPDDATRGAVAASALPPAPHSHVTDAGALVCPQCAPKWASLSTARLGGARVECGVKGCGWSAASRDGRTMLGLLSLHLASEHHTTEKENAWRRISASLRRMFRRS